MATASRAALAFVLACLSPEIRAQDQGLLLTLERDGAPPDVRVARLLALHVPGGNVRARFEGFVEVPARERATLHFAGTGNLSLEIDGALVIAPGKTAGDVRLKKGKNAIRARYEGPPSGDATFRVQWIGADFLPEPWPPHWLSHTPNDALAAADLRREGESLFTSRGCAQCHLPEPPAPPAPSLVHAGDWLERSWTANWLADPAGHRPAIPAEDSRHLAAFLATQRAPLPEPAPDPTAVDGNKLWDAFGCIACHAPTDRPLQDLGQKWQPRGLLHYLRSKKQPDFRLSWVEAAALEVFLRGKGKPGPTPDGDATRGKALARQHGCANCHALAGIERARVSPLTPKPAHDCKLDHRLDERERGALRAFLAAPAPVFDDPGARAEHLLRSLRCDACHPRDGRPDLWSQRAGKESELRPHLTWAGEKLQPSWIEHLLAGKPQDRPRPWLHARMPAFPAHAKAIAQGLAAQHGLPPLDEPRPAPDKDQVEIGKRLVGTTGFTCTLCHGAGAQPPAAVFEAGAQGINFLVSGQRLRRDWALRWMRDPLRIDPATRMPKYADANGKTAFIEVRGGDATRQFEAVWAYLCSLR
jgi:mono/diheme cytochrome c family protein